MWEDNVMTYVIYGGSQRQKAYREIKLIPDQTVPEVHIIPGPF